MCLIAYVPAGKSLKREVFDHANRINPHGIGVMSSLGVEKFFGNKQLKRARTYVNALVQLGLAHAVHWRFATHGTKGLALCHPFKLPEAEVWFMHNGVISSTSPDATENASDTLLYVNDLDDAPKEYPEDLAYWTEIGKDIGQANKALVMYPDGQFIILNKDNGCTVDDIWYSNSYSLPASERPATSSYFLPERLRPTTYVSPYHYRGSSYETGRRAEAYGGPFGSMIYWSNQMNAYGFWEGMKFTKLKITEEEVVDTTPPRDPSTPSIDDADKKCPRCMRFKQSPPMGFLPCWCRKEDVEDYVAKLKAKWANASPSGPTLETISSEKKATDNACEHGNATWEDCRECISRLETDGSDSVQRWRAHRQGYRMRSTDPQERADELASNVLYLPKASAK